MEKVRAVTRYGLPIVLLALMAGCAPRYTAQLEPRFEHSNQVFLQGTIEDLGLVEAVSPTIPSGSVISLASLEQPETSDHPVVAMVEDGLLQILVRSGYKVLERDRDVLGRLVNEGSGDTYRQVSLPPPVAVPDGESVLETQLLPADFLLSYRVLECGIIYRTARTKDQVKREAMLRMHLRVQDTRDGQVLLATELSSVKQDEIDSQLADDLAGFHYSFFPPDLPVGVGPPSGGRTVQPALAEPTQQPRRPRGVKLLLGLLVPLVGIAIKEVIAN